MQSGEEEGSCSFGERAVLEEQRGYLSAGSGRKQGTWAWTQEGVRSALGSSVPLGWGLTHQLGLCPEIADMSHLCHGRVWMRWSDSADPRI